MNKDFRLEIKSVGEDGTFVGLLSVYNVVDLGNDLVEPGAFSKSIQEKGRIPMLWQHKADSPIGDLELEDTPEGLKVVGRFLLELKQAQEAYALVKAGIIKGLSIGYNTIKYTIVKGVRHLKELRLLEGSVVTFPMNTLATISSVKEAAAKADFLSELEMARIFTARHMMHDALCMALDSITWSMEMSSEEKLTAAGESIDQFKTAYLEMLPKLFELWGEKAQPETEGKAGRRISAATRAEIEESIAGLQALLEGEAAGTPEGTTEAAGTLPEEAAAKDTEPEDALHSAVADSLKRWQSGLSTLNAA